MKRWLSAVAASMVILTSSGCDEIEIDIDGFDGFGFPSFYDPYPYYRSDVVVVEDYYYEDYYYDDYFYDDVIYWW